MILPTKTSDLRYQVQPTCTPTPHPPPLCPRALCSSTFARMKLFPRVRTACSVTTQCVSTQIAIRLTAYRATSSLPNHASGSETRSRAKPPLTASRARAERPNAGPTTVRATLSAHRSARRGCLGSDLTMIGATHGVCGALHSIARLCIQAHTRSRRFRNRGLTRRALSCRYPKNS